MHIPYPSLPHYYAVLERFFWDAAQLCHFDPLDGLDTFKIGPLDNTLNLEKKSHTEQDQVNKVVVPVQ